MARRAIGPRLPVRLRHDQRQWLDEIAAARAVARGQTDATTSAGAVVRDLIDRAMEELIEDRALKELVSKK